MYGKEKSGEIGKMISRFKEEFIWYAKKPDGQPRRMVDVIRAEREFEFKAKVSLKEGLKRILGWYKGNRRCLETGDRDQ
ncbi:MAG: hypothetical protein ACFFAE_14845 [Candidatus Hodarchaeota archaeon]